MYSALSSLCRMRRLLKDGKGATLFPSCLPASLFIRPDNRLAIREELSYRNQSMNLGFWHPGKIALLFVLGGASGSLAQTENEAKLSTVAEAIEALGQLIKPTSEQEAVQSWYFAGVRYF